MRTASVKSSSGSFGLMTSWPCCARNLGFTPPGTECQPCRKRIFMEPLYLRALGRRTGAGQRKMMIEEALAMNGHAGFGWTLLVVGLVIAGVGLVLILVPSIPWLGQ